jgi:hypothetical protein
MQVQIIHTNELALRSERKVEFTVLPFFRPISGGILYTFSIRFDRHGDDATLSVER